MDLSPGNRFVDTEATAARRSASKYGAPDFSKRTFFRAVVDGQYKLVRWFSPKEYGNPATLEELYASGDVTLHDLVNDPGELENIGNPAAPEARPGAGRADARQAARAGRAGDRRGPRAVRPRHVRHARDRYTKEKTATTND